MADLKIWDSELHKKYTGSYNDEIKSNFIKLDKLGVSITARTPLVPEIDQEIDKISDFLKKLKNVKKYELLKYHPLGKAKYDALEYKFEHFSVPTEEYFKEMQKYAFDIC
jgi:pyruvate formate lyase activating enzyme